MFHPKYHTDQRAADSDLLTRVGIALTLKSPEHARNLHVEIDHGIVILRGQVPTKSDRRVVEVIVGHLAGVRQLDNQVRVSGRSCRSPRSLRHFPAWLPTTLRGSAEKPLMYLANRSALMLIVAALLLASGCSEATPERVATFPVEGAISFKGQPIPGAFVALHPRSPLPDVPPPRASVTADGGLKISTYDGGDGAPEGEYVLTVEWFKPVKQGQDVVAVPECHVSPLPRPK